MSHGSKIQRGPDILQMPRTFDTNRTIASTLIDVLGPHKVRRDVEAKAEAQAVLPASSRRIAQHATKPGEVLRAN